MQFRKIISSAKDILFWILVGAVPTLCYFLYDALTYPQNNGMPLLPPPGYSTTKPALPPQINAQSTPSSIARIPISTPSPSSNSLTWWGVAAVEIRVAGRIIHFDPIFRFARTGHYILSSHSHTDHCNVATQERIINTSPFFRKIIEPENCQLSDTVNPSVAHLKPGQKYEDDYFVVTAAQGRESSDLDSSYLVEIKRPNLFIFHTGDAQESSIADIKNTLATIQFRHKRLDYLLVSLGKLPLPRIKELLAEDRPRYLVPIHYPFITKDITDRPNLIEWPQNTPYGIPPYSIAWFVKEIQAWIDQRRIPTKLLLPSPGAEIALDTGS